MGVNALPFSSATKRPSTVATAHLTKVSCSSTSPLITSCMISWHLVTPSRREPSAHWGILSPSSAKTSFRQEPQVKPLRLRCCPRQPLHHAELPRAALLKPALPQNVSRIHFHPLRTLLHPEAQQVIRIHTHIDDASLKAYLPRQSERTSSVMCVKLVISSRSQQLATPLME